MVCLKFRKRFPFALCNNSHVPDVFEEVAKLLQHATFEDLRVTFDCLSFRSCRCTSFREKMLYGYCIIFFQTNRPVTLAYGTSSHSYVIGFCSRIIGLKAYLDCVYEQTVWDSVLSHEDELVQANFVCITSSNTNSKLSF